MILMAVIFHHICTLSIPYGLTFRLFSLLGIIMYSKYFIFIAFIVLRFYHFSLIEVEGILIASVISTVLNTNLIYLIQ